MKNNRKKNGFTLIELIIVIAIFSVIMSLVMSFIQPVSKIMTKTSIKEKTAAYVDNIGEYLDKSVRYARYIEVYEGNFCDNTGATPVALSLTDANEKDIVKNFVKVKFNGAVDGSNSDARIKAKVRVLKLINNSVDTYNVGRIYETEYNITAGNKDESIEPEINKAATREVINPVQYSDYSFYYTLGYNYLRPLKNYTSYSEPDTIPSGEDHSLEFKANPDYNFSKIDVLNERKEKDGKINSMAISDYNFPLSIVAMGNDATSKRTMEIGGVNEVVFKSPSFMQTISMTLVNAKNAQKPVNDLHGGERDEHFAVLYKTVTKNGKKEYERVDPGETYKVSYKKNLKDEYFPEGVAHEDNIYIVFVVPEEIYDTTISYK